MASSDVMGRMEGGAAPRSIEAAPETIAPRELTVRAVATGMVIGSVLSLCNIYAGLKIGWGFNMSVTAALLGFGAWQGVGRKLGAAPFGLLESNINQTTASAAAGIASAGLVSALPAYTMLTGERLPWATLSLWLMAICLVGVAVATGLRQQLVVRDQLAFPGGVATAETVKQLYARGREGAARVRALLVALVVGAGAKLTIHFAHVGKWAPALAFRPGGALGARAVTLKNLGLALDPSPLMVAMGVLIGPRASLSLGLGGVVAWAVLAPYALAQGWATPGPDDAARPWFSQLNSWMLWPGVGMMVAASLTSLAFSWRSVWTALRGARVEEAEDAGLLSRRAYLALVLVTGSAAVAGQVLIFDLGVFTAVAAVLFTFFLAVVAGRVSGETGITPVGPLGKVTQLCFGVAVPGSVTTNLMAANVTGGAAAQCGDLLHDLKTGHLIGATPRRQVFAQSLGVIAGAMAGCAGYLLLVPEPAAMLLTEDWPAPAVAQWKAVAELFARGLDSMPPMAPEAMGVGAGLGAVMAVLERRLPARVARFFPSPGAMGLASVIPAWYAFSAAIGGLIRWGADRWAPEWSERKIVVIASGLVAGITLAGVGLAMNETLKYFAG